MRTQPAWGSLQSIRSDLFYLTNRGGVECRHAAKNAREPGGSMRGARSGNPNRSSHYLTVRR
jgi:hypothetical protein